MTVIAEKPPNVKSVVLSLAKGFRVLEVFDHHEPELTVSEIAAKADLDTGTAFRLVKTLVMLGYLEAIEPGKRYRLSLKVLDLGFNAIARMELHSVSRPVLRSLISPINEAASIAVLDGADMVYIERIQAGLARLGVTQRIGSRIPAYCTAVGYAVLAHLPVEQRMHVLHLRERVKLTPNTPVSIPDIEQRLQRVRKSGYAFSDQDTVLGVRVVAAPILDADGQPWASVSTAAPSFVCSPEEFIEHSGPAILEAAEKLARILRVSGSTAVRVEER